MPILRGLVKPYFTESMLYKIGLGLKTKEITRRLSCKAARGTFLKSSVLSSGACAEYNINFKAASESESFITSEQYIPTLFKQE